jgi:hypothetical protein
MVNASDSKVINSALPPCRSAELGLQMVGCTGHFSKLGSEVVSFH